jgi:plastocyanin
VNRCTTFADGTLSEEARVIAWTYRVASSQSRCLRVLVGQSVTWEGTLGAHSVQATGGGDAPNPILGDYSPEATSYSVTFPNPGVFGYECGSHSAMRGAIEVVALPP